MNSLEKQESTNNTYKKGALFLLGIFALMLTGCAGGREKDQAIAARQAEVTTEAAARAKAEIKESTEAYSAADETFPAETKAQPVTVEADWGDYFGDLNGTAVFYNPDAGQYTIYNQELADVRRSPCSTFKIISSLAGIERGVISSENSTRTWSGESFWNEAWNRDIDFESAFKSSCIWYFREVINELGPDAVQEELNRLQYGNCDISDWEGRLNTNNTNRALTGFWVESSLKISPREQTEVLERIFGGQSPYRPETLDWLRQAMQLTGQEKLTRPVYGKTGLGKLDGVVVDAWYAGFLETGSEGEKVYFCVYLGKTDHADVSSTKAKEIAVDIIADHY